MSTATLFVPGQPPLALVVGSVPAKPLATFFRTAQGKPDPNRLAVADTVGVAQAMGLEPEQVSLLYSDATTLVYARANAGDAADAQDNPAAEEAVYGACGELSELVGRILLMTAE